MSDAFLYGQTGGGGIKTGTYNPVYTREHRDQSVYTSTTSIGDYWSNDVSQSSFIIAIESVALSGSRGVIVEMTVNDNVTVQVGAYTLNLFFEYGSDRYYLKGVSSVNYVYTFTIISFGKLE